MLDKSSTVFLFKRKNKLVLLCQILVWKITIYLPVNFPIMTASVALPPLTQRAWAALLCAFWQVAPLSSAKPAVQKLVNELPLSVEKKIIMKDQKHPHKSQCALQNMCLSDSNELWEGFTPNAIHRSVNCNSRMYLVLVLKTEMPLDTWFSHKDVSLHLQATVQNSRSGLLFLYIQNN